MAAKLSFGRDAVNRRAAAAVASLTAAMLLGGALRADDHLTDLPLMAIVYNHAGLSPATLNQAVRTATKLYRLIGVEITWLPSESPDLARLTSEEEGRVKVLHRAVFVRLLSPAMVDARNAPEGVLGQAVTGSQFVSVLTPRVATLADRGQVGTGVLLGHVIAHEIGHLLLPSGHSLGGLMSGSLDVRRAGLGQLAFDARQGQSIRERLLRLGDGTREGPKVTALANPASSTTLHPPPE